MIGLDAGRREAQPGGIGHPAHRHDRERSLSTVPYASFEKIMRTPRRVFSKDSIAPKSSRTTIPDSRKAAATAADTSSSSVGRMRGAWKSWTREPKALKIEATCAPVAPPPMTNIGGTEVRPQASLWVAVNSKPGLRVAGSRRPCK